MSWTKITKGNIKQATPYHEKTDYKLLEKFIIDNDIVSFKKDINYGTTVLRFFQNSGKSCGNTSLQMKVLYGHPFIDHYMFFKDKKENVIFTSQPYAGEEYIQQQFEQFFTKEFELKIYDSKDSWYCPGMTTLFTIKLKNTNK